MSLTIKDFIIFFRNLLDAEGKRDNVINNFENWFPFIHNKKHSLHIAQ